MEKEEKLPINDIKKAIRALLKKEGGAAGLGPILKLSKDFDGVTQIDVEDILDNDMKDVEKHRDGDYILKEEEVKIGPHTFKKIKDDHYHKIDKNGNEKIGRKFRITILNPIIIKKFNIKKIIPIINIVFIKIFLFNLLKSLKDLLMITFEIELGITGGEEDGVDNSDVDVSKLYTQPEEVAYAYEELSKISDQFTIAAAFGNVHGVYKPGNVKLTPKILKNSQEHITEKYGVSENHIDFVFHGGSGSTVEEIREGISYGVIKMNIDTDMQYAFMSGVRDDFKKNEDYLAAQIGNPEGDDLPNKKYYDPRRWLREGEKAFINRLKKAFEDLNNVDTL